MTPYIIQIVLFQALFLGVYHLFLKKETFFNYNRLYLILTPIVSLVLPLIKIAAFSTVIPTDTIMAVLPEIVLGNNPVEATTVQSVSSDFQLTWQSVYLIGLFGSLGIFGTKLFHCMRLFRYRNGAEHIITIPNSQEAFSFLHFIFMGDGLDPLSRKQILAHEQVHVQEKHSWDLLVFEVMRIVFWFNPLVYIYQRNIAIVHEYIADAKIAGGTTKQEYYQDLLNMTFGTQQLSFTNTFFNHSFIKNRILMLQKSKSKRSAQLKYLLILPVVLSMMMYVSCTSESSEKSNGENLTWQEEIDKLYSPYENRVTISQEEYNAFVYSSVEIMNARNGDLNDKSDAIVKLQNAMSEKYSKGLDKNNRFQREQEDIPFAVIEKVPVYPGCESSVDNAAAKKCMSQSLTTFVVDNFNSEIGSEVGLSGTNKIFVQFKINQEGNVVDVRSRAPHPALEKEAERVMALLPQMKPGMQKGEAKSVLYSLPITFKIEE
jgi:beta-lactamase regulating signal transducer with metallopeptidase domain